MKKNRYQILFCLLIIVIVQCENQKEPINNDDADYRVKFCGDFSFRIVSWRWYMLSTYYYDTNYYQGTIEKIEYADSLIRILYMEGRNKTICSGDSVFGAYIEPMIDSSGILFYDRVLRCSTSSGFTGSYLSTDSLYLDIKSGGRGSTYGQKIIGIRLKQ